MPLKQKLAVLVFFLVLLISSTAFVLRSTIRADPPPNIIIINFDDLGYGDFEPYGMLGVPSPNINRLAREGLRLTNFNVAQAVCTTSRAALLTGCYPNRLGLHGALPPWAKIALNPQEETIASLLKTKGYQTAILGKWHLGSQPAYYPARYGFDSYFGIPYSNDMWPVHYDGTPVTDPANGKSKYPPLPLIEGEKPVRIIRNLEDQALLTTSLTERAVSFISQNKKKPFFLYLAHPMPHVPLAASARFRGKSEVGLLGDVLMELDWSVGEVMRALDQEKLSSRTLLIVTSDNGPWLIFGDHAGSSGGFKEGKQTTWEGGTRVPCLIRWPGKVAAGGVSGQLLTNMDILPTVVELTGAAPPKKKIDGLSFAALLLGKTDQGPREVFYYYYDRNNLRAVRQGNWKLVLPHTSNAIAQGTRGKGGFPGKNAQVEVSQGLYNLTHDPGEQFDVQELYPEKVRQLLALAEEARADLGDDLTGRAGNNVRPAAVVE
jgi:arylsulfatase A-like enzyme